MRMSGFVLGGLVGAAAAMYFSRSKNKMMLMSSLNQSGQKMSTMMNSAKDKVMNAALSAKFGNSRKHEGSESGLDHVEKIVQEDPALKHEVDRIMHENNGGGESGFRTQ